MKVVVTGATGFIGKAVVRALVMAEADVVPVIRGDEERAKRYAAEMLVKQVVLAETLESQGPWCDALDGAGAVLHLAGEPVAGKKWDARQKQVIRDSRVESTRTIVEAIARLPVARRPRVLVCASGIDYYPFAYDQTDFDDDEVTEADPAGDSFLARVCRDWEHEALAAEKLECAPATTNTTTNPPTSPNPPASSTPPTSGPNSPASGLKSMIRVACMRTGLVLGKGGGALPQLARPFKLFAGGRIGGGRQWMSWIHLDDVVGAYLIAIEDERYRGPINLVTASVRNYDFARVLGEVMHRPSIVPTPAFAVRMAAGKEFSESILQGRRVMPTKLRELGFPWQFPTLDRALTEALD